jgi:hypothetical protein
VDGRDLYICDHNNDRVQVLQKDAGTYQRQWGSKGTEEGQFDYPVSIHLMLDRKEKERKATVRSASAFQARK